ncbi:MAG: GntR family transcriptional regulator [Oscillospiraceae bacterium]|nr:GntR family transcriptional regulator [Oscillospiraceae bacterium]
MNREFRSDLPIYVQLIRQIRQEIVSGAMPPGERLPSVREIAAELGVNPNTVQRALQELERDGLIYTQRTSGRFVTEDAAAISRCREMLAGELIRDFLAAMTPLGYQRQAIVRLLQEEKEEEHECDS